MSVDLDSPEFQGLFYIMVSITILKLVLCLYLGKKMRDKTKREGKFEFDFLFGVWFLMLMLFIGRAILTYWDFYLTKLDPNTYHLSPNVEIWKFCMILSSIGFATMLFIIDKKGINFKLKGIIAYTVIGLAIIRTLYPVHSMVDFQTLQVIQFFEVMMIFSITFIFIYMGIKVDAFRKTSVILVTGIIIYGLSSLIINEAIASVLRSSYGTHLVAYSLFAGFKFVGLIMITYGTTKIYNPND